MTAQDITIWRTSRGYDGDEVSFDPRCDTGWMPRPQVGVFSPKVQAGTMPTRMIGVPFWGPSGCPSCLWDRLDDLKVLEECRMGWCFVRMGIGGLELR